MCVNVSILFVGTDVCPFLYHEYPQEHDPMQPNHPLYCGRSPGIGRKVCFPGSWLGLGKECIRCNCMGSVVVGTVLPTTRQAAVVVVVVVVAVLGDKACSFLLGPLCFSHMSTMRVSLERVPALGLQPNDNKVSSLGLHCADDPNHHWAELPRDDPCSDPSGDPSGEVVVKWKEPLPLASIEGMVGVRGYGDMVVVVSSRGKLNEANSIMLVSSSMSMSVSTRVQSGVQSDNCRRLASEGVTFDFLAGGPPPSSVAVAVGESNRFGARVAATCFGLLRFFFFVARAFFFFESSFFNLLFAFFFFFASRAFFILSFFISFFCSASLFVKRPTTLVHSVL